MFLYGKDTAKKLNKNNKSIWKLKKFVYVEKNI